MTIDTDRLSVRLDFVVRFETSEVIFEIFLTKALTYSPSLNILKQHYCPYMFEKQTIFTQIWLTNFFHSLNCSVLSVERNLSYLTSDKYPKLTS